MKFKKLKYIINKRVRGGANDDCIQNIRKTNQKLIQREIKEENYTHTDTQKMFYRNDFFNNWLMERKKYFWFCFILFCFFLRIESRK